MSGKLLLAGLAAVAAAVLVSAVEAGEVSTTVPFALDSWIPLGAKDGPVTLHRIRLAHQKGPVTKSTFFRPGNTEFLENVQIQLEYSNPEKPDWKAELDIVWLDDAGNEIDGYRDDEGLDGEEGRDTVTVTLSTLKYGIARAQKLKIGISFHED